MFDAFHDCVLLDIFKQIDTNMIFILDDYFSLHLENIKKGTIAKVLGGAGRSCKAQGTG